MANKNKGTVYQQLNQLFNSDGGIRQQPMDNTSKNKIIIKGNSPEEVKMKGLELEQKRKLQDKFFRTTDRGFQKALQYEAARLPAYIDYEGMEYYPLIASALDLYMEESTAIGINGKMLNIHSNKERIKFLLEEFFYDIINVNVNLPFWARNLVKYGDNFILLYGDKTKGITHVKQMVNYEIERYERIQNSKPVVKFKERMTGDEFNTFEIAHFRLLGDDKYLPYGSSILNKVRRVFRQLIMAEDAMLTYRIIRAGEKKVFKIDVGNIDDDDIEDYINKVATKFKRTQQVSPSDGQIDYRFNILGNDEDYFLPVRNANTQTSIETLPGAQNLNDIADIDYLRDNLFMGLGIPKPFLSFQDAAGGGKNLAQFDIRFAKKVNRIQQSLIQELNKMAMIHLYLLGYSDDELTNFSLSLTNPSTQLELLNSELLRDKASTYRELTATENGIAAMSHTNAKKIVFNWSEKQIVNDLKEQKMEKVVIQEFQDAPIIIKNTGIFKSLDNKYGEPIDGLPIGVAPEKPSGGDGSSGGAPDVDDIPEPPSPQNMSLSEYSLSKKMSDDSFNSHINKLVYGNANEPTKTNNILTENVKLNNVLNSKATDMVTEIDELLSSSNNFNKHFNDNESIEDLDLEDLEFEDLE